MSKSSKPGRSWYKRAGYQIIRVSLWFAFKLLFGYRQTGTQNFPREGAALVCSNHQSHLDPTLVGVCSTRRMNFLAKKELFNGPLGWLIAFLDSIPIDRDGISSVGGMKETLKRLRAGEMVLIFPEGTRTRDGQLQPMLPGVIALIRRVNVPVIPAGVAGAYEAWPRGRKIFRPFSRINVAIGEPIPPERFANQSEEAIMAILENAIRDCIEQAKQK